MDEHKENSKEIAAYLLLCDDLTFEGTEGRGDILYFIFTPSSKAKAYADKYILGSCKPIQPKSYSDSQQRITEIIWRWRKQKDLLRSQYSQ